MRARLNQHSRKKVWPLAALGATPWASEHRNKIHLKSVLASQSSGARQQPIIIEARCSHVAVRHVQSPSARALWTLGAIRILKPAGNPHGGQGKTTVGAIGFWAQHSFTPLSCC